MCVQKNDARDKKENIKKVCCRFSKTGIDLSILTKFNKRGLPLIENLDIPVVGFISNRDLSLTIFGGDFSWFLPKNKKKHYRMLFNVMSATAYDRTIIVLIVNATSTCV